MKVSELKQIIAKLPNDGDVEFVFAGNHFSVKCTAMHKDTLELIGIPMHDMPELNLLADDYLERRLSVSELINRAKNGTYPEIELTDYSLDYIKGDIVANESIDENGYDGYDHCTMWIRNNFRCFIISDKSLLILTIGFDYVFIQHQQCGYSDCFCDDADISNVNYEVLEPMRYAMWEKFKHPSIINEHVPIDEHTLIYVKK